MFNTQSITNQNSIVDQDFVIKISDSYTKKLTLIEQLIEQNKSDQYDIIEELLETIIRDIQQLDEKYQDNNTFRSLFALLRNRADLAFNKNRKSKQENQVKLPLSPNAQIFEDLHTGNKTY